MRLRAEIQYYMKKSKLFIHPQFLLNSAIIEDDLRFWIFLKDTASNVAESYKTQWSQRDSSPPECVGVQGLCLGRFVFLLEMKYILWLRNPIVKIGATYFEV